MWQIGKPSSKKCNDCFNEEMREEFKVKGEEVVSKVKELIKEGNARRIIIKNERGKVLLEVPLTIGVVGVALAPVVAAVGALAALVSSCSIVVEKESLEVKPKRRTAKKQ